MAWNEPGNNDESNNGSNSNQPPQRPNNPWGQNQGNGNRGGNRGNQSPPDLDEVLAQLKQRLSGLFGGGNGSSNSNGSGSNESNSGFGGLIVLLLLSAIAWFAYDSAYTIDTREQGVVMRFGEAREELLNEGFHLRWPRPIERVIPVNTRSIDSEPHKSMMITKDLSIVQVSLDVQYRRADPVAYVFNMTDPEFTLKKAISASIRKVIGEALLDDVLTNAGAGGDTGRGAVNRQMFEELTKVIAEYNTGILITEVNINEILPPEKVRPAFEGITKAGQESEREVNKAQAEKNKIETEARGEAKGILSVAERDAESLMLRAKGEAERFEKLYQEYQLAPEVTRDRLYLETMEKVLSESSKVIVDVEEGNNMMVLPIDQIIKPRKNESSSAATSVQPGGQ